jgi:hypothetical protein
MLASALVLTGGAPMLGDSVALASNEPEATFDNRPDRGATVTDRPCAVRGFAGLPPGVLFRGSGHTVVTPSGNATSVCHVEIPKEVAPDRAVVTQNFVCGTPIGSTRNSHIVVTPGGQVILTCHVNGQ